MPASATTPDCGRCNSAWAHRGCCRRAPLRAARNTAKGHDGAGAACWRCSAYVSSTLTLLILVCGDHHRRAAAVPPRGRVRLLSHRAGSRAARGHATPWLARTAGSSRTGPLQVPLVHFHPPRGKAGTKAPASCPAERPKKDRRALSPPGRDDHVGAVVVGRLDDVADLLLALVRLGEGQRRRSR